MSQRDEMTNTKDGDMDREHGCTNTDTKLFQEVDGDFYSPSCHMTKDRLLGINVGGSVYVKPLRSWAELASKNTIEFQSREQLIQDLSSKEWMYSEDGENIKDIADFVLSHTSELRKENEELKRKLKITEADYEAEEVDRNNADAEVARLKELVDGIKKALSISRNSVHDGRREALAKIAEYKESK